MANGWKVPFRYVWQALIGGVGVLFIVLGAMGVTKNPDADRGAIVLGITAICEVIYLMARGIPRFEDAGEQPVTGTWSTLDVLFPIGIFVLGIVGIVISSAAA